MGWTKTGDLIPNKEMRFRQVGWLINGGEQDGKFVKTYEEINRAIPIGSFSPVYVQVDTD